MFNIKINLFIILIILLTFSCNEEISVTPPNAKPQAGYIFVTSKPTGAAIYLNGLNTGRETPDSIDWLDSGDYRILLRLKGWKDTLITTHINKDEKKSFYIDFTVSSSMLGAIYCTSEPEGADVFFNDSATGKLTPLLISGLLPGEYKIFLNKINYLDDSIYVEVESQKITKANIVMTDTMEMVTYNTRNSGIPSNSILCIAVDNNNLKWIGTDGAGISSFDGANFITYNKTNSPLPDNRISSIYVDVQNNKWIGTTSGGLAIFNGLSWIQVNSTNSNLPDDLVITKIIGDKNGKIWISTTGYGIIQFDRLNSKIYNKQNTGMPIDYINDMTVDNNNVLYFATYNGIVKYDGINWSIYNNSNSGIPNYVVVLAAHYNNYIFAKFNLTEDEALIGLPYFAVFDDELKMFNEINANVGPDFNSINRDSRNRIWVSGSNGFLYIERYIVRKQWTVDNSNLPNGGVLTVVGDNNNMNLHWIGTQVGGLVKLKGQF